MNHMCVAQLEILLHYYATPGDYRYGDFSALTTRKAIDQFLAAGALQHVDPANPRCANGPVQVYEITPKGEEIVKQLCALPGYPELHWTWNPFHHYLITGKTP